MKKAILALALAAGLTSFAGSAKAGLTYNFSFNGAGSYTGSVAGVLTLNDAGTQATSAYVTSSSLSFNPLYNWVDTQNNYVERNSFTGDQGKIVFSNVYTLGREINGGLYLGAYGNILNGYASGYSAVVNFAGPNGITYTPSTGATSAVPEPSQVAASLLLAASIAGFVIVKRRKEASALEALAA